MDGFGRGGGADAAVLDVVAAMAPLFAGGMPPLGILGGGD